MAVPSSQLARENRRMEERLGMLREMMRAEKAKRGYSLHVGCRLCALCVYVYHHPTPTHTGFQAESTGTVGEKVHCSPNLLNQEV